MNEVNHDKWVKDLRRAAERVRWAGSRAHEGPWDFQQDSGRSVWSCTTAAGSHDVCAQLWSEQDARWVSRTSPHIAVPLAEMLEEAAAWAEHHKHQADEVIPAIVRFGLPLAWSILRTGETW